MPRGRPQRSPLEPMRAKAWMAGVMEASGATSAYQVAKLFDVTLEKRFEKYARGEISPTSTTLNLVERVFPKTRQVYLEGPAKLVPLWQAMNGTFEATWECLVRYDPEFEVMRLIGIGHNHRVSKLMERLGVGPIKADLLAWERGYEPNSLPWQIDQSPNVKNNIGLDELAALIALWRISVFIGIDHKYVLYVLDGVERSSVMPALLKPWGIEPAEVSDFLNGHSRRIEELYKHLLPPRVSPVEPRGW